jgi:hypothetical protein
MREPIFETVVARDVLAAHQRRRRRFAVAMVVTTTLAAVVGPLVTAYLGWLGAVAIGAWVVAVPMWRSASSGRGAARRIRVEGRRVTESIVGGAELVVSQPIVGARAFDTHLELIVGTLAPSVVLHEVHIPWTPAERGEILRRLSREHEVLVVERGAFVRHLLAAFALAPLVALAYVVAHQALELATAVGVLAALASLNARGLLVAAGALAVAGTGLVALRIARR